MKYKYKCIYIVYIYIYKRLQTVCTQNILLVYLWINVDLIKYLHAGVYFSHPFFANTLYSHVDIRDEIFYII